MIAQVCFPFFDTRFSREDADDAQSQLAPRWLFLEPPPLPLISVGRLGTITKYIPPRPYARCLAGDLIRIAAGEMNGAVGWIEVQSIELMADQRGHTRLTVTVVADTNSGSHTLAEVVSAIMATEVTVQHPERRNHYETFSTARSWLADLYGRESSRSTPAEARQYDLTWISVGRPFAILANTRREELEFGDAGFALPVTGTGFAGAARFLPWRDDDGEAMPVWYLDAPRGGNAWQQPADALANVTAQYEELFLCSYLRAISDDATLPARNLITWLEHHIKGLAASLQRRNDLRHGISQHAALRLLSDHDSSILQSRRNDDYEAAILGRVQNEVALGLRAAIPSGGQTIRIEKLFFDKRETWDMSQTTYGGTGNLFNFGIMADNTITITNKILAEASAPPDLKQKLEELRTPLIAAAKALPEAEAQSLLKDYETFTEAALRESPPKPVVKALGEQLIEVTKKVAEWAEPVASIVGAVMKLFV